MRVVSMGANLDIKFIDNTRIAANLGNYEAIDVVVAPVIESWRESMFSFEWLDKQGDIRSLDDLPDKEKPKRERVEALLAAQESIEKPVLGIGLKDNVEIGMGRAEFLTLAAHKLEIIPVHVPKSNLEDFKPFVYTGD